MILDAATRLLVIGNSGSGKSTLAKRVGEALNLPIHDLDLLHWHPDGRKRAEVEAKMLVADIATGAVWVIEGVYGWLAEVALTRATALVWLDLSWAECREGLLRRGMRRGMTLRDQEVLLDWANAYWMRTTSSSFAGHARLYDSFGGRKAHLRKWGEVAAFSLESLRLS